MYMYCFAGQYTKQFTETGTFYVWSGYVDSYDIKNYAGTVEVGAAQSRLEQIRVKVGAIEALHDVGGMFQYFYEIFL